MTKIGEGVRMSKSGVRLGKKVRIGDYSVIGSDVTIADGVTIGRNVVIYPQCRIGRNSEIEDNSVLGYSHITKYRRKDFSPQVIIGNNVLVRTNCVIYTGVIIGNYSKVSHGAVIREGSRIGNYSSIGNLAVLEGCLIIGNHTSIFAHSLICPFSEIEDYVFVGPGVVTTNDYNLTYARKNLEKRTEFKGPHICDGVRVGGGVILMPGVVIGRESVIGAGSLVSTNIPPYKVAMGWPARVIREVDPKEYIRG